MIALEEKKLQGYKHKLLSFERGEHKSQEVLEINPRGQVGVVNPNPSEVLRKNPMAPGSRIALFV